MIEKNIAEKPFKAIRLCVSDSAKDDLGYTKEFYFVVVYPFERISAIKFHSQEYAECKAYADSIEGDYTHDTL